MSNCTRKIIMVLEGETEIIFYTRILEYIYSSVVNNPYVPRENIEFILARGVGNIGVRSVQTFKLQYYDDFHEFVVFCCYDTDVFENNTMPRLWTQNTVRKFMQNGAARVHSIQAKHMIEDWYFYDYEGILKFLGLDNNSLPKSPSEIVGSNAVKKLNRLYRSAKKIYQKGYATDELISNLNIDKIYMNIKDEFISLIKEITKKNV